MKPSLLSLVSSLLFLADTALSGTTYHCNSEQNNKFHLDCIAAYTQMILSWTGSDLKTYVPSGGFSSKWGRCTSTLKGSNTPVSVVNLISSFNQLGSRCQNGYFFYDDRWLTGTLAGIAGWKRDVIDNTTALSFNNTGATTTAEELENTPPPLNNTSTHIPPPVHRLNTRQSRTYISGHGTNIGVLHVFRVASYIAPQLYTPNYPMIDNLVTRIIDIVYLAGTTTHNRVLTAAVDGTTGSTVVVATLAMQLEGGFDSWQTFFNRIGMHNEEAARFMLLDSVVDWRGNGFDASVYQVVSSATGNVLVQFIINAVNGQASSLPSS